MQALVQLICAIMWSILDSSQIAKVNWKASKRDSVHTTICL